jgi:hypothetical protein
MLAFLGEVTNQTELNPRLSKLPNEELVLAVVSPISLTVSIIVSAYSYRACATIKIPGCRKKVLKYETSA